MLVDDQVDDFFLPDLDLGRHIELAVVLIVQLRTAPQHQTTDGSPDAQQQQARTLGEATLDAVGERDLQS